jgi:hypothetical protein
MNEKPEVTIYTDGGASPNPGGIGSADHFNCGFGGCWKNMHDTYLYEFKDRSAGSRNKQEA